MRVLAPPHVRVATLQQRGGCRHCGDAEALAWLANLQASIAATSHHTMAGLNRTSSCVREANGA